jgi:hypothetical protein
MRIRKRVLVVALSGLAVLSMLLTALVAFHAGGAHAASIGGVTRTMTRVGTVTTPDQPSASDAPFSSPEFGPQDPGADAPGANAGQHGTNRSFSGPSTGNGSPVHVHKPANDAALNVSFDGINHRQQRLADNGNQFSTEPPDQGMCASNGYVFESVNDAVRVYDTSGNPLSSPTSLNRFYGYPSALNRTTGAIGPNVFDTSCIYDQATGHFFNLVATIDQDTSGNFLGTMHLDLAVSNTSSPLPVVGGWTIYSIPVQDDGTQGTPNHNCRLNPDGTGHGPCFGDYPHIGADANGIYLTTNEYDFFGNGFHGAQVYAISKSAIASLPASVTVTQFDTATAAPGGLPGFTLWPTQSPGAGNSDSSHGGTEYFLSSTAADEAQCTSEAPQPPCRGTRSSSNILLWSLTNTSSLSGSPSLTLSNSAITVDQYAVPPKSNQQAGQTPLADCINDTSHTITSLGPPFKGCWQAFFATEPGHNEVEVHLDSNDTRMQQTSYAHGEVWGALDTAVNVNNKVQAGIEYFVVNPHTSSPSLVLQDTVGIANDNLTYPAMGVLANGRGVMAFTVVGNDFYPSAGYAALDDQVGIGTVNIAAKGQGPDDGFTGYAAFLYNRPRWGDYGAASVVGSSIWIASEYIGQTCNLQQYTSAPFGSCGGTRSSIGNWGTRISEVTP